MHRSAPRLARLLACAAVPVMLVVAGCSSDSDKKDSSPTPSASKGSTATGTAKPAPAKFAKLPADPCKTVSQKTVNDLVPNVDDKTGKAGKTSDTSTRSACTWNGLDSNGVDGSQFRWLDVSFQRFETDAGLGSGEQRAKDYYAKSIKAVEGTPEAKDVKTAKADGIGDEATSVSYTLTEKDNNDKNVDSKKQTVVSRTGNVVVTVNFNGAGYAGAKAPNAGDMLKDADKAAKEAVASVAEANK